MEKVAQIIYLIPVCFIAYFIISYQYKILNLRNLENALLSDKGITFLNLKHTLGILLFGVIFYFVFTDFRYLLNVPEVPNSKIVPLFLITIILVVVLSFKSARKRDFNNKEIYKYGVNTGYSYFIIRFLFLLCYEFFFRGVLFFALLRLFGLEIAIIITTLLYMLIHVFDSKEEFFGALPFGIVLCLFSYYTNTIWAAFIIHIALSGVYEISMFIKLTLKTIKS